MSLSRWRAELRAYPFGWAGTPAPLAVQIGCPADLSNPTCFAEWAFWVVMARRRAGLGAIHGPNPSGAFSGPIRSRRMVEPDALANDLCFHLINKKATRWVAFLLIGGGGGDRTRVRKSSILGPTCLVTSLIYPCRYRRTGATRGAWDVCLTAPAQTTFTAILNF